MKIVNKTNLSYQYLGWIIDQLQKMDEGQTHYYGQIQYTSVFIENNREIKIEIKYLKRYCEFIFTEKIKEKR